MGAQSVSLILYAHPFSSYCQKVLIALYESATPFEFRMLSPDSPTAGAEFVKTSTGFHPAGGASVHAVELMVAAVGPGAW